MQGKKFNIAHIVSPRGHGLYGYREVIETVQYGLTAMGCDVTVSENAIDGERINIIFGAQMLSEPDLKGLPEGTIIYNFEQIAGLEVDLIRPSLKVAAEDFQIWEYSEANIPAWEKLNPTRKVVHVPVGWAPILNRIKGNVPQDIDVLIYGLPGQLRLQIFHDLCHQGVKCLFVSGMYGSARDNLISRSKLVLNINLYDHSRIFEIVRVSYLLANAKAVVADARQGTFIEPGLENAVAFSPPREIRDTCLALLMNDQARLELEDRGRQAIEKRPILPILSAACEKSDLS
ncbi:MAG: hypothetical protein WA373_17285 [Burkholderiales bacterium]